MFRACACLLLSHVVAYAAAPLPAGDALTKAKRAVIETYGRDLASEEGQRKMLADAGTMQPNEQAAVYIVLTERGTSRVAFDALDQLGQRFDFDSLAGKVSYVEKFVRAAKKPDDRLSAFNRAVEAMEEAVDAGRLKLAERCLKAATAARVKDAELRKELAERRKQLEKIKHVQQAEDKALADARKALDKNPKDAVANECVGRHLAMRGDWQHALKHLAKADISDVRKAALAELSGGIDAAKQLGIADAWWNAAEVADAGERRAYRTHAVYWYTLASPSLTGLAKTRAEKRIAEAGSIDLAGQATVGEKVADVVLGPGVSLRLVKIPASEDGKVRAFWLGQTEVTQKQWTAVMGKTNSEVRNDSLPVTNEGGNESVDFCKKLSELSPKFIFHLPTVAEWLHACGDRKQYDSDFNGTAWYKGNSGDKPHPVATLRPNAFRLYDMFGNVEERCEDGAQTLGFNFLHQNLNDPLRPSPIGVVSYHKHVGLRVAAELR